MKNEVCECTERAALIQVYEPLFLLFFCTEVDKETGLKQACFWAKK